MGRAAQGSCDLEPPHVGCFRRHLWETYGPYGLLETRCRTVNIDTVRQRDHTLETPESAFESVTALFLTLGLQLLLAAQHEDVIF